MPHQADASQFRLPVLARRIPVSEGPRALGAAAPAMPGRDAAQATQQPPPAGRPTRPPSRSAARSPLQRDKRGGGGGAETCRRRAPADISARPRVCPMRARVTRVPEGFTATPFATGRAHPRLPVVLPTATVLVASEGALHHAACEQTATARRLDRESRRRIHSALRASPGADKEVLVADQDGIWRVKTPARNLRPAATSSSASPIAGPNGAKGTPHIVRLREMIHRRECSGIVKGSCQTGR